MWKLDDTSSGQFLKNLRTVKPEIPTTVFVKAGGKDQGIAARSLGVSAVLTDDSDEDLFRKTVAGVLGLKRVVSIKSVVPVNSTKIDYEGIAR